MSSHTDEAIPSWQQEGSGQPLHFLHANGYPPECYTPLLKSLGANHEMFGMLLRPLWQDENPDEITDWSPFSEDLRRFLKSRDSDPVIGVGHSIGAIVTLRAALREPGLFRALVLIEPVLLPRSRMLQLGIGRTLGVANRLNRRMAGALERRRHFDSLEQLFNGYRTRDVFRYFSDENLWALIRGLTRPSLQGGFELVYSPEWEARIYETGIWNDWDLWAGLRGLQIPMVIIRGAETDTFWESTARGVARQNSSIAVVSIGAATHLVPMERPGEVSKAIQDFIHRLSPARSEPP